MPSFLLMSVSFHVATQETTFSHPSLLLMWPWMWAWLSMLRRRPGQNVPPFDFTWELSRLSLGPVLGRKNTEAGHFKEMDYYINMVPLLTLRLAPWLRQGLFSSSVEVVGTHFTWKSFCMCQPQGWGVWSLHLERREHSPNLFGLLLQR